MSVHQMTAMPERQPLRDRIALMLVAMMKPVYFLLRHDRKVWSTSYVDLASMPEGTLGKDLAKFLYANQLELMPRAEFHDVYHVLFGFSTIMKDETTIQFVVLGNGRWTLPHLVTNSISLVFYPEHWGVYYRAFQLGRRCNRFHNWDFEPMLGLRTDEVRKLVMG